MELPNTKELSKIIALCRKSGVSKITVGNITLELGPAPIKTKKLKATADPEPQGEIETDGFDSLPEEAKLFWSSSPEGQEIKVGES